MSQATVIILDPETKKFREIPQSMLPKNFVLMKCDGREGLVWADPKTFAESAIKHPPFSGVREEAVRELAATFGDVGHETSYDAWEEGFRRDRDCDTEIAIWLTSAKVFRDHQEVKDRSLLYKMLCVCMAVDRESAIERLKGVLPQKRHVRKIIDDFYDSFSDVQREFFEAIEDESPSIDGSVVPIDAFLDEFNQVQTRGVAARMMIVAQVIGAIDLMTDEKIACVYGRDIVERVASSGIVEPVRLLTVGIDSETDDLERLAAIVVFWKGKHDIEWKNAPTTHSEGSE